MNFLVTDVHSRSEKKLITWLRSCVFVDVCVLMVYLISICLYIYMFLGVKAVLVALIAGKAEIHYDAAYILPNQLANKVSEMGFEATVLDEGATEGVAELVVCIL